MIPARAICKFSSSQSVSYSQNQVRIYESFVYNLSDFRKGNPALRYAVQGRSYSAWGLRLKKWGGVSASRLCTLLTRCNGDNKKELARGTLVIGPFLSRVIFSR